MCDAPCLGVSSRNTPSIMNLNKMMFCHVTSWCLLVNYKYSNKNQFHTEIRLCFVDKTKIGKVFIVMTDNELKSKSKKCMIIGIMTSQFSIISLRIG